MRREAAFHILVPSLLSSCIMSTLDKLAIRGIRSFDDKGIAVIQFRPPVTVIVGHNGSGKTTIIECLKYATTGDQPPGTRGGAFIHDPKIANEKEVKAQVKLRFKAADGRRILAIRNLSVTQKKTAGMTMKTLESILSIDNEDGNNSGKVRYLDVPCLLHSRICSVLSSQQSAPSWILRYPGFWASQKLYSKTSSSVIRKILIGRCLKPQF
jgi:predicted ATP-dependent endonuclease of OLD family